METLSPTGSERKPTGLLRGQAAKIARIHKVSITYVQMVARGQRRGRPAMLNTIEEYRERNRQAAANAA